MTTPDARRVIVADDGSAEAQAAVRTTATLSTGRTVRVVSVWEPMLEPAMPPHLTGASYIPPDPEAVAIVEQALRDHAADTANAGAERAPRPDEADIGGTIAAPADRCDACAVVVGSRGLGESSLAFWARPRAASWSTRIAQSSWSGRRGCLTSPEPARL